MIISYPAGRLKNIKATKKIGISLVFSKGSVMEIGKHVCHETH